MNKCKFFRNVEQTIVLPNIPYQEYCYQYQYNALGLGVFVIFISLLSSYLLSDTVPFSIWLFILFKIPIFSLSICCYSQIFELFHKKCRSLIVESKQSIFRSSLDPNQVNKVT